MKIDSSKFSQKYEFLFLKIYCTEFKYTDPRGIYLLKVYNVNRRTR